MSKNKAEAEETAPEEAPAEPVEGSPEETAPATPEEQPAEEPATEPAAGEEEPANPTSATSEDTSSTATEEAPALDLPDTPAPGEPTKAPDREAQVVNTALNPDTWPDQTSGTVTDPEVLRRHGLEPKEEGPAPAIVVDRVPAAPSEQPSPDHELFHCLRDQLPTGHTPFWSDDHRNGGSPVCPECGSKTVIRDEGVATA